MRRLRAERRWTQEEAAYRCDLHTVAYQRIEAGRVNASLKTLSRVAMGFSVNIADLFPASRDAVPAPQKENENGAP